MKALIIADVHLKPVIFDKAEKILESGQADYAVVLGDLLDDWGEEFNIPLYTRTLKRAIEFHKKFPKTLWCMGNHDFAYYHPNYGSRESGHSKFVEHDVGDLLKQFKTVGIEQKIVRFVDNCIFSHAGVTTDFVAKMTLDGSDYDAGDYIETLINDAEPEDLWDECSPIWARPQVVYTALFSDKLQVVGHTPMKKITQEGNLLSTDVFSTYRSGAPYGERRFAIVDTANKTWEYAEEEE